MGIADFINNFSDKQNEYNIELIAILNNCAEHKFQNIFFLKIVC